MLYDILLDVGGTGIKGGYYFVEDEVISELYCFPSHSDQEKDVIIKHLSSICGQIWDSIKDEDKKVRSIRMAFPGPFEYDKGISKMKGLAKYESLINASIPKELICLGLKEAYPFLPKNEADYKFMNDVKAYATGVMKQRGLSQGYRVLYLCIGTGAGSAYSVDGEISCDRAQGIPEHGWIYSIAYQNSIIDDYISARGIGKLAQKYCNKALTPLELSAMAQNGDDKAIQAYQEFGENLKAALLPLLLQFGANTLVIGGKISLSGELFLTPIKESCARLGIDILLESDTSRLAIMGLTMLSVGRIYKVE